MYISNQKLIKAWRWIEQRSLYKFFVCVFSFLNRNEAPLWVTLILFALTAYGTYKLSPKLNEKFEQQKIISTYVTDNLQRFNSLSRELVSEISIYTRLIHNGQKPSIEKRDAIFSKITELQWRAVELRIIFEDADSSTTIEDYKNSLNDLRKSVEKLKPNSELKDTAISLSKFTDSSMAVFDALARKAGLKTSISENSIEGSLE